MDFSFQILLIAVVLTPILWFTLVRSRGSNTAIRILGKYSVVHLVWERSFTEGFQHALDVFGEMNAKLLIADPNTGEIKAIVRIGLFSFVFKLEMRTSEGVTIVKVKVANLLGIDLGLSRLSATAFEEKWQQLIPSVKE